MFSTERKGKEKQKYVYFGRRNYYHISTFRCIIIILFYLIKIFRGYCFKAIIEIINFLKCSVRITVF